MKLLTRAFKTFLAKQSITTLSSQISQFYIFAGRAEKTDGWVETKPSVSGLRFDTDREIIFGYRVTENDISLMVKNTPWVLGETYDQYDDDEVLLETKRFYVVVLENDGTKSIFKCLKNRKIWNAGAFIINPVFDKPSKTRTSLSEPFFTTSDGYEWKYLYNISIASLQKFETQNLVPITGNLNISNTAVFGAIDIINIEHPGSGYVKYAYANIKDVEIGGNRRLYSIFPDTIKTLYSFDITTANTIFAPNVYVDVFSGNTEIATGEVYFSSNTQVQIVLDNSSIELETFLPVRLVQNALNIQFLNTRRISIPNISYNTGDYNEFSIYVKGGTGAGQLRTVKSYTVSNNNFFIEIDNPFITVLDNTSRIQILPKIKITGDGVGSQAIVEISNEFNLIENINIINRGTGYTFALAEILSTNSDKARIKPIISPIGGHSFDIAKELNVNAICVSSKFDSSVNLTNGFNKIGLIGGANFNIANTQIFDDRTLFNITNTFNGLDGNGFRIGEILIQESSGAKALIHEKTANTMYVTNIEGIFTSNTNLIVSGSESFSKCLINSITYPNRIKYLCETFYIEDLVEQIDRTADQQEIVKILIEF